MEPLRLEPAGSEPSQDVIEAGDRRTDAPGHVLLVDRFTDERPPGSVIGSRSATGAVRRGRDRERTLAIDGGEMRVPWLSDPGWGRVAVTYGPFDRDPGRAVAVTVLNGLSTSQTPNRPPGGREMVARWRRTFPRLQVRQPELHESMAAGWFTAEAASRIRRRPRGACVVASATFEEEIGKLEASAGAVTQRAVEDVQNVPVTYVVLLRHGDAMFYASSMSDVRAFPAHPFMRPLGVLRLEGAGPLFAGVQQAVVGEVQYRIDTRVSDVVVADVPALARWYGSAVVADSLTGAGPVGGSWSEAGGRWEPGDDRLIRTPDGAAAIGGPATCVHEVPGPVGLAKMEVGLSGAAGEVSLGWSGEGGVDWALRITPGGAELVRRKGWAPTECVAASRWRPSGCQDLQIVDDGFELRSWVDGEVLFEGRADPRIAEGSMLRLTVSGSGSHVRNFEVHPREVAVPEVLQGRLPRAASGVRLIVEDDFGSTDGALDGWATDDGTGPRWERTLGAGTFERTGARAARVCASRESPNPGRTIYTVPWSSPNLVDIEVTVTPPGTRWGEKHQGRSGIALWQDPENYLAVNHFLEDTSVGVSISAFGHLLGREVMREHDATWTNVNGRIRHGVPFVLRVSSDGAGFSCWVDGELVLHRRFIDYTPDAGRLTVNRIGLVANWEWGDDTGSVFRHFRARGR
jgi:hypothetical protein